MTSSGNVSGILASQIYQLKGAPWYSSGESVTWGMEIIAVLFFGATYLLLRSSNIKKEQLRRSDASGNGMYLFAYR